MSIVPLRKITLCGLQAEKESALEALQRLGCVHLLPLGASSEAPEAHAPPPGAAEARRALKYLLDCRQRRRQLHEDETFDAEEVVRAALSNQQRTREAADRRDFLARRIEQLEPWGHFTFPPLEALGGQRLWFYVVPHYKLRDIPADVTYEVVHRDPRDAYVVAAAPEEPGAMPVPRTHTGAVPLGRLRRALERTELELEDLAAERAALTRWIALLSQSLDWVEDRAALRAAQATTLDAHGVFASQGWAPAAAVPALEALASEHRLAVLVEPPRASDRPPTLLENPDEVAGGQEVVAFYQLPGYGGWDPSTMVFGSFALFFAMILSDAGYALVFGVALALLWRRLGTSLVRKRLRAMGLAVAAVSLVYGVIAGGYFGAAPPAGSLLEAARLIDVSNFESMMRLSVGVGVAHLVAANAATARHRWPSTTALAPAGWTVALVGAFVAWLGHQGVGAPALFRTLGPWMMGGGCAAVLLFAGERALARPIDVLWRLLQGLRALGDLSRAFGDTLSYLRLFALGLASSSLALTFNQLAADTAERVSGVGLLLAALILLLGHGLNFVLAVVSGVVHGLRLNLIEFYNWSVSEEGYPFRAFEKKESAQWTS